MLKNQSSNITHAELERLSALSASLGRQRKLIQASGGNTSLKSDGILWVKASGIRLADATERSIFVPVKLEEVRRRMYAGDPDPVGPSVLDGVADDGLRPSIETTLHAALEHKVVVHTHSVAVIAKAVRRDAAMVLKQRLAGVSWSFVPYARPGLPLTQAVIAAVTDKQPDVLILANHGIVAGGEDCEEARQLLDDVERRLEAPHRRTTVGNIDRLKQCCKDTSFRLPRDDKCHALGTNAVNLAYATGGSLYPDHLVFLGRGLKAVDPGDAQTYLKDGAQSATAVVIRGAGVLIAEDAKEASEEMLRCLADVVSLIPQGAPVIYLSTEDEDALLGWDAEKFRQATSGWTRV